MKKTARTKRLRLSTETVRNLSSARLRRAAGGTDPAHDPEPVEDASEEGVNACGTLITWCWPCDTT